MFGISIIKKKKRNNPKISEIFDKRNKGHKQNNETDNETVSRAVTFPYQGSKMKGSSRKKKQTSGCSQLVISILILSYFSFPISDTVSFLLFLIFSLSFFVEVLIFYNYSPQDYGFIKRIRS